MSSLPFDFVINILCCLPVKSLVRFKTVLKSWHSLIDSPYFINLHLARSIETNNLMLYMRCNKYSSRPFTLYCTDLISLEKGGARVQEMDRLLLKAYRFCGSFSDGLLLLYIYETSSLVFWNPSTKKLYHAPNSTMKLQLIDLSRVQVETLKNDRRVAIVRRNQSRNCLAFFIYSLQAISWRTTNTSITLKDITRLEGVGFILYNGAAHFLISSSQGKTTHVAFDLGIDESCGHELSLPAFTDRSEKKLGLFDGNLCVSSYDVDEDYYELWVMKEYEVEDSWVLLFSATCDSPIPRDQNFGWWDQTMVYSKNRDKLLSKFTFNYLSCYDLKTERFTKTDLHPKLTTNRFFTVCPSSLVSVALADQLSEDETGLLKLWDLRWFGKS